MQTHWERTARWPVPRGDRLTGKGLCRVTVSAKTTDENDYEALVWEQGSKILGDP